MKLKVYKNTQVAHIPNKIFICFNTYYGLHKDFNQVSSETIAIEL